MLPQNIKKLNQNQEYNTLNNANNPIQYLAVAVLGQYISNLPNELSTLLANSGCHLVEGRMNRLGQEFNASLLINGNWSAVAKFETYLNNFAQKNNLALTARRTEPKTVAQNLLPYLVYVTAQNTPSIVSELTQFFEREQLAINHMTLSTYLAPHTSASMLNLIVSINVPVEKQISDIREQLLVFSDFLNLDVVMEPEKD